MTDARLPRRNAIHRWCAAMIPAAPAFARRPDVSSYSRRRLYGEIVVVFLAFFGASVVAAAFDLAGQYQSASHGWRVAPNLIAGLDDLGEATVAVLVVVALSHVRGVSPARLGLRPKWAARSVYRWQAFAVVVVFFASSICAFWLMGLSRHVPLSAITLHRAVLPLPAWPLLDGIPKSIMAGVVEELVVVAFFVTVARQARMKTWQIVAIGVVLRLSYHIYYGRTFGWSFLFMGVWALAVLLVYLRTGRVTPLIIAHIAYDSYIECLARCPHSVAVFLRDLFVGLSGVAFAAVAVRAVVVAFSRRRTTVRVDAVSVPILET